MSVVGSADVVVSVSAVVAGDDDEGVRLMRCWRQGVRSSKMMKQAGATQGAVMRW